MGSAMGVWGCPAMADGIVDILQFPEAAWIGWDGIISRLWQQLCGLLIRHETVAPTSVQKALSCRREESQRQKDKC